MEKIVLRRVFPHLGINGLLPDNQHGIKGRLKLTAIIDLVEHIADNLVVRITVTATFLDLGKAFDCLNHKLILAKLKALGFRETALK